jgi:hypothetical protein
MVGAPFLAALGLGSAAAQEHNGYPDWKGQWFRAGGGSTFDPDKPGGLKQQPPLKPEYQSLWESRMREPSASTQDYNPQARCLPGGMPRMMIVYEPMEVVVTPETTYVLMDYMNPLRRIYTDGRDWPATIEPTFAGYSIGKWQDPDSAGRYQTLVVETRGLKGPRIFESSGIPLHEDNQTVVLEKIHLEKSNPEVLVDEMTTIDNALTRPWTVKRTYRRERNPVWFEFVCAEGNPQIAIGGEQYFLAPDGTLMPLYKGQRPPAWKFFDGTSK